MSIDVVGSHILIESPKAEDNAQFCEAVEGMIRQTYGHRPDWLQFSIGGRFVRDGIYFREFVCPAGSVALFLVRRATSDGGLQRAIIYRADNDGRARAYELRAGFKQEFSPDELQADHGITSRLVERVALLTVETTFCIRGNGGDRQPLLIVHPDLSVPASGWRERTELVWVLKPDGQEVEANAQISLSHFNIKGPDVSIDRRWRVSILFRGLTSNDVPDGSKIFVLRETRDVLLPNTMD